MGRGSLDFCRQHCCVETVVRSKFLDRAGTGARRSIGQDAGAVIRTKPKRTNSPSSSLSQAKKSARRAGRSASGKPRACRELPGLVLVPRWGQGRGGHEDHDRVTRLQPDSLEVSISVVDGKVPNTVLSSSRLPSAHPGQASPALRRPQSPGRARSNKVNALGRKGPPAQYRVWGRQLRPPDHSRLLAGTASSTCHTVDPGQAKSRGTSSAT